MTAVVTLRENMMRSRITLLFTFLFIFFISCENILNSNEEVPKFKSVKYDIQTNKEVHITISNEDEGTEMYDNVTPPWEYSFNSLSDQFVYVSAQVLDYAGQVRVKNLY